MSNNLNEEDTPLRDKEDYFAKRKVLQDLQLDPDTNKDGELSSEIVQRMARLNQQASAAGIEVDEARYHGRDVPLNRPLHGDVKKFKVYVKNKDGKVVKVNFNASKMHLKNKCKQAGHNDTKARYWSCRMR